MKAFYFVFGIFSFFGFHAKCSLAAIGPHCFKNGVSSISFTGIKAAPYPKNLCEAPVASVPPPVMQILQDLGDIHHKVASLIGESFSETFKNGIAITFSGDPDGSRSSYTLLTGEGVILTMFPDWNLKTWPKITYTHELTHALSYRAGAFSKTFGGLITHPLIQEALPDLVALTVHQTTIMPFEDQDLPDCLKVNRNATPLKSWNDPLQNYYLFAANDQINGCCAKIPLALQNAHTRVLCEAGDADNKSGFYGSMPSLGSNLRQPTQVELNESFTPSRCLYQMKGFDVLGACDTHQFAIPLVSFFSSLQTTLGRSLVSDWIAILKAEVGQAKTFKCSYQNATSQTVPAELLLRKISSSLQVLRGRLTAQEKMTYDQTANKHGIAKVTEMDSLYYNQDRANQALAPLLKANPKYASDHGCGSVFTVEPGTCAAVD